MTFKREIVIALFIAGSLHIGIVAALTLSTPPEPLAITLEHGFEMVELAPLERPTTPSTPLKNKIEADVIKISEPAQPPESVAVAEAMPEPAEQQIIAEPEAVIPEIARIVEQPQPEVVVIPTPEATPQIITPTRQVLSAEQVRALPLMLASIDDIYISPASRNRYLHNPKPRYPRAAKKRGIEGMVMVNVRVGRDGRPLEVLIHTSSGYGVLDRAALKAVRGWRFEAARRGNTRVEGKVLVPINFELTEKG